jgi:hypothetical protein
MRLWLKFCLIWAVFSLVWGPLTGPDTVKDRILHALVPLILQLVTTPILRAMNFRRAYREHGRDGVYGLIGLWVFVLTLMMGPGLAMEHGYPRIADKLGLVLVVVIQLPLLAFCWWLGKLVFKGLLALGRLVFAAVAAQYTRSLEP